MQYPGNLTDEQEFYIWQKYGWIVDNSMSPPYPGSLTNEQEFIAWQRYGWLFDDSMPPPYPGEVTDEQEFYMRQKYPEVFEFFEDMFEKCEREDREQEILRDLDSLFYTWDLYPASRLPMWEKIVLNALCLKPGTEVDVDIIKKIGDQKHLPHSFIDEAVKYYGRFPFDTDKIPPPLKPAPERWKDSPEERRLPPELSRIVQCFLDCSGEETLSEALCRAVLNAKNTRMLIRGLLDMPSPDGNPVEREFSLRSFFDEYEEPLLYAIFGDTRVTCHAVKTGPNSASVKLSFRHSFEWKDIMRNDLEKFFDTPQEKSGWIYRSTKLIGNISDENYELNAAGGVASYKLQVANSGVASLRDAGDENAASVANSGEAATNPTGGLVSGSGEAATNPTGGPTSGTGVPSLQNMPGGPELLRNRIFDAFLRRAPEFNITAGDMQLLLNSEALALRFRAYPPSGEPQKARLVFEEDKDNELYFALGEAYVSYSYQPEQKDGSAPHQETAETAAQPEPAPTEPVMLLKLDLLKHWEWIDLMRNGFDKYFPETKERAEYAYSSLDVKGSATVEGMPAPEKQAEQTPAAAPQTPEPQRQIKRGDKQAAETQKTPSEQTNASPTKAQESGQTAGIAYGALAADNAKQGQGLISSLGSTLGSILKPSGVQVADASGQANAFLDKETASGEKSADNKEKPPQDSTDKKDDAAQPLASTNVCDLAKSIAESFLAGEKEFTLSDGTMGALLQSDMVKRVIYNKEILPDFDWRGKTISKILRDEPIYFDPNYGRDFYEAFGVASVTVEVDGELFPSSIGSDDGLAVSGRVTLNKTWSWDDIKRNKLDKTTEAAAKAKDMESARMKVTGTKKTMLKFYKNELPRLKGLHVGSPFEQQSDPGNPWKLYIAGNSSYDYPIIAGKSWTEQDKLSSEITPVINTHISATGSGTDILIFSLEAFAADMVVTKGLKQYHDIVNCSAKFLLKIGREGAISPKLYDVHIDDPKNNTSIIGVFCRLSEILKVEFKIGTIQKRGPGETPSKKEYPCGQNLCIRIEKR